MMNWMSVANCLQPVASSFLVSVFGHCSNLTTQIQDPPNDFFFVFVCVRNNWNDYHPHTNVLWLHYLCSKLLSMKYRSSGGRGAKDIREELARFYDNLLQYSSATEVLKNCPMFQ